MDKLLKQAFTLIELLVVIAIIGILSGLIVVSMSGVTDKATIAKAQVFSNSLRNSLMLNLVAEYKFNVDGSDAWGGNNATLNGATIVSSGCLNQSCLNVVGGGVSYASVADNAALDTIWSSSHNFTLEAWINSVFYNTDYQGIINKRNSNYFSASPGGLFISNDGNTLYFLIGTGNDAETYTSITYSLASLHNKWVHVVGTANGSQMKLYINGVMVGTPTSFSQNPPANNDPLVIGSFAASVRSFNGKIDDVRLYNAAIPVSKVQEHYYLGLNSLLTSGQIDKEEYASRLMGVAYEH